MTDYNYSSTLNHLVTSHTKSHSEGFIYDIAKEHFFLSYSQDFRKEIQFMTPKSLQMKEIKVTILIATLH